MLISAKILFVKQTKNAKEENVLKNNANPGKSLLTTNALTNVSILFVQKTRNAKEEDVENAEAGKYSLMASALINAKL